ncbi:hypothetical protein B4098_1476 [Heyndrickxia coagulans]|uniref:Uncharacterized protein n=1 Tax=Heyndrickxia coagulans TaxID=1398 RepID=A0A150KAZ5_HEYCO|nr:hypothetical protein B4098_1476 [Heyndrickxia coagulans]
MEKEPSLCSVFWNFVLAFWFRQEVFNIAATIGTEKLKVPK